MTHRVLKSKIRKRVAKVYIETELQILDSETTKDVILEQLEQKHAKLSKRNDMMRETI